MEKRKKERWLIYGANGYTGKHTAQYAKSLGHSPVLSGRNAGEVQKLSAQLGLSARPFDLTAIDLSGIDLVLHCAGPFSKTSRPMLDACLKQRVDYLDITGEIGVFEAIFARHQEIERAGIVAIPGVGFDVVPTDCVAMKLKEKLPSATHLELAIDSGGGSISRGTLLTMIENLPNQGCIRRNGKLTPVPQAHAGKWIKFPRGKRWVSSIPWGDVSTAFHSTGIPNITVYAATPPLMAKLMRFSGALAPVLGLSVVQRFLETQIKRRVTGPDERTRNSVRCQIWGEVRDDQGQSASLTIEIPEGYRFTSISAVAAVERILSGNIPAGASTPSRAFGANFVLELPETREV